MLRDDPLPGPLNMARDHALASTLPPGSAVLRLYRWAVPTLSLGRNEPARGRYEPGRAREAGIDLVRRPTGGRAVLHWRELTYAAVLPLRALGGVREAYVTLNRALRWGLAALGVPAAIAGEVDGRRAPAPDAGPCFREPAPGEVVAGGRKLVGSAQARIGRALLQHGSILLADDQRLIDAVRGKGRDDDPASEAESPPATLGDLLGRPVPWETLADAVEAGFREQLGGRWRSAPATPDPDEEARLEAKYRSPTWTWRR
ncbi:MAG: hypothetical protein PVI57_20955 [Gemmatimonadota bacterium]